MNIDSKTKAILESLKSKKVGVFCDDSNLYHSYLKYGWRVDFGKFRRFLEKIKPYVILKEKKLKYTPVAGKFVKKGDVDVEITLDVVRTIDSLDVVIIISGDSDLLELRNYVIKDKRKNIIFWAFEKNMAWELKYGWHLYLDDYKKEFLKEFRVSAHEF